MRGCPNHTGTQIRKNITGSTNTNQNVYIRHSPNENWLTLARKSNLAANNEVAGNPIVTSVVKNKQAYKKGAA
jgi:hypothetical protein